jgi:hypothetical protein
LWDCLFDYTLYQGFRLFQYAQMEKQLEMFATFKQLQKAKKKVTFRSYLYSLSGGNGLGEMIIQEYFPGLKECINR